MDPNCLFCKIVAGDEAAEIVAREGDIVAFKDKFPRAPVHVLVVPEQHIPSAHELDESQAELLVRCFSLARRLADENQIADGYRIATNIGRGGGQAIPHLHFHVLGGKQLGFVDGG